MGKKVKNTQVRNQKNKLKKSTIKVFFKKNKITYYLSVFFLILILLYLLFSLKNSQILENKSFSVNSQLTNFENSSKNISKVKIEYFFDYQCRWCKKFEEETFDLVQGYINNRTISFEYVDFVFIGQDSYLGAISARCIENIYGPEKFSQFHKKLYRAQKLKNSGWLNIDLIKSISKEIGVEETILLKCILEDKYRQEIINSTNYAYSVGVVSTPSFLIDGKLYAGFIPKETFKKIIDERIKVLNNITE